MNEVIRPRADILLVDDDADLREELEFLLNDEGYSVRSAANGLEGLKLAQELAPPFVVVMDLNMPVLNGYDLLDQLKQHPQLQALPVIVITARPDFPPANVPVLGKPFDLTDLLQLIEKHIPGESRSDAQQPLPTGTKDPKPVR